MTVYEFLGHMVFGCGVGSVFGVVIIECACRLATGRSVVAYIRERKECDE